MKIPALASNDPPLNAAHLLRMRERLNCRQICWHVENNMHVCTYNFCFLPKNAAARKNVKRPRKKQKKRNLNNFFVIVVTLLFTMPRDYK